MTQTNMPIEPVLAPRRNRFRVLKTLALSAVIFLAGGAAGYGVSWIWHPPFPPPPMTRFLADPPLDDLVDRLRDDLVLSDDQVKQVRQIYQQRRDALDAIRDKMDPEFKAEYDKLDFQMKSVLNPDQYRKWSQRFHSIRDQFFPPPPHGGPGPWGAPGGPGGFGGPGPHGPPDGGGPEGFPGLMPPGPGGPPAGPPPPGSQGTASPPGGG